MIRPFAARARMTRLRAGQLRMGDAFLLSSERSSPAGPTGRRGVQTQATATPASGDIRQQAARRTGEGRTARLRDSPSRAAAR